MYIEMVMIQEKVNLLMGTIDYSVLHLLYLISTYSNLMTDSQLKQVTTAFPSSRCRDTSKLLNENPGTKESVYYTHAHLVD
jgi:hypothetical protein